MPTSLSGWPVLDQNGGWDDPRLTRLPIPGTPCVFYGRASVAPLFVAFILDYARAIHPLRERSDVDAYDYRPARAGGGAWSDHSAGIAVDLLASGVGAQGSEHRDFWASKENAIRLLLAKYDHLIYWGGSTEFGGRYSRLIDPMHFYLRPGSTQADVDALVKRLGIRPDGTTPGAAQPKPQPVQPRPALSANEAALRTWLLDPARGITPAQARVLWAVAVRESGCNPALVYPAGQHDPAVPTPPAKPSDWGVWQINTTHLPAIREMFGAAADMRRMLDIPSAFRYVKRISKDFTDWRDWGFRLDAATGRVTFDWSRYPAAWVAANGASAERGLLAAWNRWPAPAVPSILASNVRPGVYSAAIRRVQDWLRAEGFAPGVSDGRFGPRTQAAYALWQKRLGYTGADADGVPGLASLRALAERHGYTVRTS